MAVPEERLEEVVVGVLLLTDEDEDEDEDERAVLAALLLVTFVLVRVRTVLEALASVEPEDAVPRLTVAVDERLVFELVPAFIAPSLVVVDLVAVPSLVAVDLATVPSLVAVDLAVVPSRNEVLRPVLLLLRKEELLLSMGEVLPGEADDRIPEFLISLA